ncbi:MAG: electron transfer flavoprotein, alpha subunit [Zestosphaera tikiterensis]|uniref:Electron transfer flavoprotein, alpha subunit n=1 Tax=Zestosphaera tikiterensis TaxID=1973259 RepID=A0A2R7Y6X8_9CREN|nr:MAG: electron transfer flavoprotein, alpha subunit [Zestosphaera tikiterensis]
MVFAEQHNGKIHPVTFELLSKGRELADRKEVELSSVILGHQIREEAKELIYYGADKVFIFDHPTLKEFDSILYKQNIVSLIREEKPEIVLIGATHLGRSLAPRIAAALNTGLTADCIDLQLDEDGELIQVRPAFTGNILAYIKTKTKPVMTTVRYKVFKARERDPMRKGEIIEKEVKVVEDTGTKILGKIPREAVNISDAGVVVAGGRGLRRPDDLKMLEELASLLGGVVGVSRPLVDEGWASKDRQVGFSGNIVKPKLYVAVGISGSPQHLAGMKDSEIVVAINVDPSAPIFNVADYGVVGDLYEVIPKPIEKIKLRKMKL